MIESREDYAPDDHPETVTVTFPDGTVIEVDENNPHTCIDPRATERRCLACEAQWIALPFPTPAPCRWCGAAVAPVTGGEYPEGRPLATTAENDPYCPVADLGRHETEETCP